jgi:hypothetical protein
MSLLATAGEWLVWAEDARRTAGQMNDPQAKRMMLGVAVGYEKLAKYTAALAESGLPMDKREAEPDNE